MKILENVHLKQNYKYYTMTPLHQTIIGRRLIEHTLPDIAHQLQRIADALEKKPGEEISLDIYELVKHFPNNADLGEQLRQICQTKQKLPTL